MSPVRRVEVGGVVVLVGPDAAEVGAEVREAVARGERVGALVGRPEDPEVRSAVAEMVDELSGSDGGNS